MDERPAGLRMSIVRGSPRSLLRVLLLTILRTAVLEPNLYSPVIICCLAMDLFANILMVVMDG